ncbi:hypothetical protein Q31b_40280 [Novipirellula aureliae]|uniref:Leucine Rich repeats (2 copies) n=1 Tax=Novipirellula aureliae TaxID=2527966 RepID=A0A5C6DQ51_9BACT|nr:hypothetical protein [Novipirellula aureliae]TWU38950.1 hypothetical protein Q31b_40280 [Novipirellula aureliae]
MMETESSLDQAASNPLFDKSLVNDSTTETRRKVRLRRRDLVVLVVLSLLALIWLAQRVLREEAPEPTVDLLPSIQFEQVLIQLKQQDSDKLHVEDFAVDDRMIQQLENYPNLETIILDQGEVTDPSLVVLESMPKLKHLRLRLSPISDEGFKTLGKCRSLWFINLPHATCTAKGVAELSTIPELRQLRLGSPNLGNEVTRQIATLKTLRGVHLVDVPVTDEGLKTLATLPYLESLYLDNSAVTEVGWRWLYANHPELHVHVNQKHNDYDPKYHKHHDK